MEATQEMLKYLDGLRASGQINMADARPVLAEEFRLGKYDAGDVMKDWRETFSARHPMPPGIEQIT